MQLYIRNIQEYIKLQGLELVTASRRESIQKYIKTEDKARCLTAGLLLRDVCGVTDDEQLITGKNGKPYLKNKSTFFNISHSGDYAVLAVADSEIGVDIEKVTHYSEAVAMRCFTQEERDWLKTQPGNEAFFRLWTAKESVMKATGFGFSLPPRSFTVLPLNSCFVLNKNWLLNWIFHDNYIICCAVDEHIALLR